MLPFGVTIPATVPQMSKFPEGLMNYPVLGSTVNKILKFQMSVYVTKVSTVMKPKDSSQVSQSTTINFIPLILLI
jgi:hypothetical protein